jgi:hypothetical protein
LRGGERARDKLLASRAKVQTPIVGLWWRKMRSSRCMMMAAHVEGTGKDVG